MSRHKVKRYDGEDGSDVTADAPDAMEQANQTENLDTTPGPKAMPSRPVSRTPVAAPRKAAARSDSNYSNEGRGSKAPEARDRFGIPGKVGKPSASNGNSADSTELDRNLEAIGNATGASAAIQGLRRGTAVGKGLAEFAASRNAAPAVAKAAEKAAPAVNVRRAAPDPSIMEKVNAGLRNAPRPVSNPTLEQQAWAKGPKGLLGRGNPDAMKKGGSVKKYAAGGAVGSFRSSADGIAQRGKTRGQQFCSGGMAWGKK
jgi:hypothetical protein